MPRVPDDSDQDLLIINFTTPRVLTQRGRQYLTGSSTSIEGPPATRRKRSSGSSSKRNSASLTGSPLSSIGGKSISRERQSVHQHLVPLSAAAANRDRRQSRASSASQQPDLDEQGGEVCRLSDETLIELSQNIRAQDNSNLPYPRNSDIAAEQLLDDNDTFLAGKVWD